MSTERKQVERVERKSIVDKVIHHICTPVYKPTNKQWEVTFRALGWDRKTVEEFWTLFCRINNSRTGEITIFEFLNYFNLDRSQYVEKCFEYFDTTGGDSIDFLEFIVSVWNICTLKVDTLTNFTFDIYDLDSDGELSLPEIERMVIELYGTGNILNSMGKEVLEDINQFAEERGGGVLSLTSFSIYTMNHSMLLFPIFRIQRIIQKRVMGIKYWENVANSQAASTKANKFDPRHVQILLRTYKTGAAAAILTHTGDPNVALKQQFDEENNKEAKEKEHGEKSHDGDKAKYKYDKLKRAVDKINAANAAKKSTKKETGESIRSKTVDMAAKAFIEAGRKARTSIAKSRLSQIPSKVRRLTNDIREQLVFNEIDLTSKQDININKLQSNIIAPSGPQKHGDLDLKGPATRVKEGQIQFTKSQKKKLRPKSAPSSQMNPKRGLLNHSRSTTFDHRRSSFKKNIRPRTPGSIVYVINEDGDFNRENNNNISKT